MDTVMVNLMDTAIMNLMAILTIIATRTPTVTPTTIPKKENYNTLITTICSQHI